MGCSFKCRSQFFVAFLACLANFFSTCELSLLSSWIFKMVFLNVDITRSGRTFNVSWVVGGHPVLDPVALMSEANRSLGILLDMLRSASSLHGPLTISVVNWWVICAIFDFHILWNIVGVFCNNSSFSSFCLINANTSWAPEKGLAEGRGSLTRSCKYYWRRAIPISRTMDSHLNSCSSARIRKLQKLGG